ncbi:MAG: tetratricopeptide repeat protein [Cyanobacteria bacterium P01_D01_bin.156]
MSLSTGQKPHKVKVFFSYAHEDESLRDELAKHLTLIERQGHIASWHDRKITAGNEWAGQIDEHLEAANIILLLISADFIASDYCWDVEMYRAMERYEAGEAVVIPIILRAVTWDAAPFAKLQALPKDAKPIRSWVDKDEAFKNVTDEIKTIVEQLLCKDAPIQETSAALQDSIHNSNSLQSRPYPINDLPQTLIQLIGRDAEIEDLHNALQRRDSPSIVALTGMPGVGKSELALQYAKVHGYQYLGGICWVNAREDDVAAQIIQFAQSSLGLTPPQEDNPIRQLNYCWQNWPSASEKVLIVIDDISSYENQLQTYLRGLPQRFKVLLTSRQHLISSLKSILLKPLTIEQAVAIFKNALPEDKRLKEESKALEDLCNWSGCLPLALQLIRNYLALDTFTSITEIYEQLQANFLDTTNSEENTLQAAKAAFELSWEQIIPEAQHLGCLLSLFAPTAIPWSLVSEVAKDVQTINNIGIARLNLLRTYLLQQVNSETVQLNSLLREFFRSKVQIIGKETELRSNICEALVSEAYSMPENPLKQDLIAFSKIYLHIEEATHYFQSSLADEDKLTLLNSLIHYYCGQSRYAKGRDWAQKQVALAERKFGHRHLYTVHAYKNAALIDLLQGSTHDALDLLIKAFEVQKQLSGLGSIELTSIEILIAVVNRNLGNLDVAQQYANAALNTRRQFLEETDPDLAEARMTLATIQFHKDENLTITESLVSKVLEVRRQNLPANHPDLPETFDLLAKIYEKQERYKEAESLYLEAKEFNEQILGEYHSQTAFSYNNLAKNYQMQNRYMEAKELYSQAIEIFKKADILPAAGWCLRNLAMLYAEMQELIVAKTLLEESEAILSTCLPSDHIYLKKCRSDLSNITLED